MIIPREVLLLVYLLATITSGIAAASSYRAGRKAMAYSFTGFAFGSVWIFMFYFALLFTNFLDIEHSIMWSRWMNVIQGLAITSASIAAYITTRGKR